MSKVFYIILLFAIFKAEAQPSALAVSDSLYAVGKNSEAIEVLKLISPASETVNLNLAKIYRAQGNFEEAEKYYRTVLQHNPDRILAALELGKVLLKQQKLETADSIFFQLTQKYPDNAEFHYQLGVIKERQQDSTSLNQFKKAVQLDYTHQDALFKLGLHELKEREFLKAIEYSQQGLESNPVNVSLLSVLAQAHLALKQYKAAVPEFEKLVNLGQGNEFVHSRLGFSYYQLSEYEKAIKHYNEALTFENRNSDTHYNLGKLYALTGELEKSEEHLINAINIKMQPVDAEFLSLGLTYKLQKDYKNALEYFDKSLQHNPENERALYERAVAADNYFKDLQSKISYYQAYLNKYESSGTEGMIYLAKTRIQDLKQELHLAGE